MKFTHHPCPRQGTLHLSDQDIFFDFDLGSAMIDTIHPVMGEITTFDGLIEHGDGLAEAVLASVRRYFSQPLYREGDAYYTQQRAQAEGL